MGAPGGLVATASSFVLTFTTTDLNDPQFVDVLARDDDETEALHFSRVTHALTSNLDDYFGLDAADVARGLGGEVAGDPVARFDASVSGSTITVSGPAFTVDLDRSTAACRTAARRSAARRPTTARWR